MAVSDLVNLSGLMDDAKCFAFVRVALRCVAKTYSVVPTINGGNC